MNRLLLIAWVFVAATCSAQTNVTPEQWLQLQTHPVFKPSTRLPKLSRAGWPITFELAREISTNWGFFLEVNGNTLLESSNSLSTALSDTSSYPFRVVALASNFPSVYQLQVNLERNWPTNMSRGFFVTNAAGQFVDNATNTWSDWTNTLYTKIVSPEASSNDLSIQAKAITGPLKMLTSMAPVGIVVNAGERDLGIPNSDLTAWMQDPRVLSTAVYTNRFDSVTNTAGMSISRYGSSAKARHLRVLTDEVKASLNNASPIYLWYNTGLEYFRYAQPGYDWENTAAGWGWLSTNLLNASSNPAVTVASAECYFIDPGSYTNATGAAWNNYTDLLTRHLGWVGYNQGLGNRTNYTWICGGWSNTDTNRLSDLRRWIGLLKMLTVSGSVGWNVGYYEFPTNTTPGTPFGNDGFSGSFPTNAPPHWLQQVSTAAHAHAFATWLDDFILDSSILPGNGAHFASTDAASCEFTNTVADATLRVIARKRTGSSEWLVGAWASYGSARSATINLPEYGQLTVTARPGGSVYWVTPTTTRLLDISEETPSLGMQLPDSGPIPTERLYDWANFTGIPGGIPNYTTIFTNMAGLDATGATDCSSQIQSAITACPPGQVVYIPDGLYLITNEVRVTGGKVVRGAGTTTRFAWDHPASASASACFRIGQDFSVSAVWTNAGMALSGATNMTLLTTNGLAVSNIVAIMRKNDNDTLVHNASQDESSRAQDYYNSTNYNLCQLIQVLTISGTNITFQPPLAGDFCTDGITNALNCHLVRRGNSNWTSYNGIEDLQIEHEDGAQGGQRGVAMGMCAYSWIKNVTGRKSYKYHCYLSAAFRCEVFGCDFRQAAGADSGGNYGIGVVFASTGNRIWNNLTSETIVCVVLGEMATANVIALNYAHRNIYSPTNWAQADFAIHDAHPRRNLFEGNRGTFLVGDLSHGSGSDQTVFRNDFFGWQPYEDNGTTGTTSQNRGVILDNWHFGYNVVGNVLGCTNVAYWPWTNGPNSILSTTNVLMTFGYTTALPQTWDGSYGCTNVYATAIIKDNYLIGTPTRGIQPEHASGETLPASLFLSAKPSWMGDLAWPPIGPNTAATNRTRSTILLPAQQRYYGSAPPPEEQPGRGLMRSTRTIANRLIFAN